MSRTILFAKSAIGTLIVIDMCHIVCHRNSLYRTVLFTFFTADTAFVTGIHSSLTFILRTAAYFYCLLVRNQLDQMMRTDSHTLTEGFTFFFIHMGDAVDDTDGVDLAQTGSSVLPGAVIVACLALTGVIVARVRREMR